MLMIFFAACRIGHHAFRILLRALRELLAQIGELLPTHASANTCTTAPLSWVMMSKDVPLGIVLPRWYR